MRAVRSIVITAITVGLLAGAAVAVSAQDEEVAAPAPPVEFSGRITCGPPVAPNRAGTETTAEVGEGVTLTRYRDGAWRQTGTVSDPRLEGSWFHTWESDSYLDPGAETGPSVAVATWRIENDEGAWSGGMIGVDLADGTRLEGPTVMVGEGAYEGLTAIVGVQDVEGACAADIRGMIFEGVPAIEPYSPE